MTHVRGPLPSSGYPRTFLHSLGDSTWTPAGPSHSCWPHWRTEAIGVGNGPEGLGGWFLGFGLKERV